MRYIHYGHKKFDLKEYEKIINIEMLTKPHGGFWASRVETNSGWKEWVQENESDWANIEESFTFKLKEDARVLLIDNLAKLQDLPKQKNAHIIGWTILDFEKIAKEYDAIEVLISADHRLYYELYGWDCDSILIMNPEIIIEKK